MTQIKKTLDSLGKLPPYVQLALILGIFALLVLIIYNPAAGVSLGNFLLSLKVLLEVKSRASAKRKHRQ